MAKETIDVLIEGGKATAAPPLGPKLGPLKVNIGQIVSDINKKTADFKGMQVPVKLVVDTETKEYEISIGTPPASQLIKTELNIKKGSGRPESEFVGDMSIEQVKKIANMKNDALLSYNVKGNVLEIAGTCSSLGIKVDGKKATEFISDVKKGDYDEVLK